MADSDSKYGLMKFIIEMYSISLIIFIIINMSYATTGISDEETLYQSIFAVSMDRSGVGAMDEFVSSSTYGSNLTDRNVTFDYQEEGGDSSNIFKDVVDSVIGFGKMLGKFILVAAVGIPVAPFAAGQMLVENDYIFIGRIIQVMASLIGVLFIVKSWNFWRSGLKD